LLAFGLYFPRHHRRDLVAAFLGVNIGVLAVSIVLGSSTIGAGLGLGLFGVLSIIRLRSDEITQHEVAYYFASLALGLLSGLSNQIQLMTIGLMGLIIAVMYVADHPRLFGSYRQQLIRVDTALPDERELTGHLELVLGARVRSIQIRELDLVNDTTLVDVRYQIDTAPSLEPRTTAVVEEPRR
jgi:Ca2+/Na+ antiporter